MTDPELKLIFDTIVVPIANEFEPEVRRTLAPARVRTRGRLESEPERGRIPVNMGS